MGLAELLAHSDAKVKELAGKLAMREAEAKELRANLEYRPKADMTPRRISFSNLRGKFENPRAIPLRRFH